MTGRLDDMAVELVASRDPRDIILRLVRAAVDTVPADRCTLTSLDEDVVRVEASYDVQSGTPDWVGKEYSFAAVTAQPLLAEAVETGKIVTGSGFAGETDPELRPDLEGVSRTAIVPLPIGDNVGALLILSRKVPQDFAPLELAELQQIGVLAVLALRNARLLNGVQQAQSRGLNALTLVSGHLASSDTLTAFFGKMSASVADLVGARRAAFWMIEGDQLVAQPLAYGFDSAAMAVMSVPVGEAASPVRDIVYDGRALGGRVSEEAARGPYQEVLRAMHIRDVVAVPWRTADRPLGMLIACDSETTFTEQDEWVLRIIARSSALVWQAYEAELRAARLQANETQRVLDHAGRMSELEERKSQFLRLASHELRGPIGLVRGYLSMLEEGAFGALPDQAFKLMPVLLGRLAQMNLIVEQLLAVARLEDSKLVVQPRPMRLDESVDQVVASMGGLARPGHTVVVEKPSGAVTAFADPDRVETILGNLLSNAIKYSPSGGPIRVTVTEGADAAEVAVTDQGVGIGPDQMPALFQRFGRVTTAETAAMEGTGLGLYLSRELARMLGGDLVVVSELGIGSTFTLTLPTRPAAAAAQEDNARPGSTPS